MTRAALNSALASPTRPAHLRQANARALLRLIQTHSPCSKADLVRYSGLSAPTISSCVAVLERLELVEAIGDGRSSGGRPPGLLRFNAEHSYVAAADIGGTRLRMMLADLSGTPLTQWSHMLTERQKSAAGMCALVLEGLRAMCKTAGAPISRVMHLTAGAPGITDVTAGVVLSAPNLHDWNDVPLRAMLSAKLKIPVQVENDTNLAAVGEHQRGAARGVANFIFLAMGTGVGAGIFIDGRLHHGARWSAGEVGYFGVGGAAREPMRMRSPGQLESVIGGGGIEACWQQRLARSRSPQAPERMHLRATQILDLAVAGGRAAGGCDRRHRAAAEPGDRPARRRRRLASGDLPPDRHKSRAPRTGQRPDPALERPGDTGAALRRGLHQRRGHARRDTAPVAVAHFLLTRCLDCRNVGFTDFLRHFY
jgi:glucokinase